MNILARYNKILREKSKTISFNDLTPKIITENNFPSFSYLLLESNDIFKNVVIKFKGKIVSIPPFLRSGLSAKINKTTIRISNTNRIKLKNNILLKFVGSVDSITYSSVSFWGGASSKGLKFDKEKEKIGLNENLMSSSSVKIEETDISEPLGVLKRKQIKIYSSVKQTIRSNINFLYTSGKDFFLHGQNYIGSYHYVSSTGQYKTGEIENSNSKILTKKQLS